MGMLMHHTWLAQQEEQKKNVKTETPVEETKEEKPVKEPVKKTGGRGRKTK